jgi:invasion protein IalB
MNSFSPSRRFFRPAALFAALTVAAALSAPGASAQSTPAPAPAAGPAAEAPAPATWTTDCKRLSCSSTVALRPREADGSESKVAGLLRFQWRRVGEFVRSVVVTVQTPLGIAVEPGLQLVIKDRVVPLPVKVCFPDGCLSSAELDDEQTAELRVAQTLEIRLIAFESGRITALSLDSTGLATALVGG